MLGGRDLDVLRPRDSEALIDEHAFEHEEFLPYWAELWPSGLALARRVAVRALHGARTLELGCGLALPSLAAAIAGGRASRPTGRRRRSSWCATTPRATASRWRPSAPTGPRRTRCSSARRGTSCSAPTCSTSAATRSCCCRCSRACSVPASELWLADPGRPPAGPFLEAAAEAFEIASSADPLLPQGAVHRLRKKGA